MNEYERRIDEEQFESSLDGFFGRTRICKYCKTSTKFDPKVGRYCPKGCFKGNKRA
jgi:hypothetical protein